MLGSSLTSSNGRLPQDIARITCVALPSGLRLNQMTNSMSCTSSTQVHGWHDLYMQAVFESDRNKISGRIRDAEKALANREHELYSIPRSTVERQAVVTAMHSLGALRSCLDLDKRPAAA
jgi:hypothetical protein